MFKMAERQEVELEVCQATNSRFCSCIIVIKFKIELFLFNALWIKHECEISSEITEMNVISHRKGEHSSDTLDDVFI